jgi:hypothetical protein
MGSFSALSGLTSTDVGLGCTGLFAQHSWVLLLIPALAAAEVA